MPKFITLCAAFSLATASPLLADGVAIVQAPEQAIGMAFGTDPQQTVGDAIAECVEQGAYAEDCAVTHWCSPAGWTMMIFAQHQEGNHWGEFYCGIPDRALIESMAEVVCNPNIRPELIMCEIVQIYDPMGEPEIEYNTF